MSTDGDDASPETRVAKIFDQMDKNNVSGGDCNGGNWVKRSAGGAERSYSFFSFTKDESNKEEYWQDDRLTMEEFKEGSRADPRIVQVAPK